MAHPKNLRIPIGVHVGPILILRRTKHYEVVVPDWVDCVPIATDVVCRVGRGQRFGQIHSVAGDSYRVEFAFSEGTRIAAIKNSLERPIQQVTLEFYMMFPERTLFAPTPPFRILHADSRSISVFCLCSVPHVNVLHVHEGPSVVGAQSSLIPKMARGRPNVDPVSSGRLPASRDRLHKRPPLRCFKVLSPDCPDKQLLGL